MQFCTFLQQDGQTFEGIPVTWWSLTLSRQKCTICCYIVSALSDDTMQSARETSLTKCFNLLDW